MADTILQKIIATKRREVHEAAAKVPLADLRRSADAAEAPRDFYEAITRHHSGAESRRTPNLIAEIKKQSPSAGLIRADFDPVAIARAYRNGGASALSILTDRAYFGGDLEYIRRVKQSVDLPVLRKDFIIDEYQLFESRAAGADAILLIAAVLTPEQVDEWTRSASEMKMTSLVEVHGEAELSRVLPFASPDRRALIGINNRDLATQRTDIQTTARLAPGIPKGRPFVTESGISTRAEAVILAHCGASAMLIGEALMRANDIEQTTRELLSEG